MKSTCTVGKDDLGEIDMYCGKGRPIGMSIELKMGVDDDLGRMRSKVREEGGMLSSSSCPGNR